MIEFILNNKTIHTDLPPGITMLDFIRYEQNLKGTKIGCREGDCGACTVLVGELKNGVLNYQSMTSCLMPLINAAGKHIVSVEGINLKELSPVQQAIAEEGGTQCGFCTVGFVMSFTGFCLSTKNTNYENALAAIDGNICRCTGYKSLERAAGLIAQQLQNRNQDNITEWLVKQKFIPAYFSDIPDRLDVLKKTHSIKNNSIIVGGGTDLYVQKHDSMIHAEIKGVFDEGSMKGIREEGNRIFIGASTTVENLRSSTLMHHYFPNLIAHLKLISSTPIRNMATVAGNFVNASPIGDMTIFFLALDASIILNANGKKRTIQLKDLYKGYKSLDKSAEEIIETLFFEKPSATTKFNFEKVSKRTHLDIASSNSAMIMEIENETITKAHVAVGGVFAFPLYLKKTSAFLVGRPLHAATVLEAAMILQSEIAPISDARGTSDYKKLLARQLFYSHFLVLYPEKISADELLHNEIA